MKTLIATLLAITFACSTLWLYDRVEEEKNRVMDLQEELDYYDVYLGDASTNYSLLKGAYTELEEASKSKLRQLERAGAQGLTDLNAISREVMEVRDELALTNEPVGEEILDEILKLLSECRKNLMVTYGPKYADDRDSADKATKRRAR